MAHCREAEVEVRDPKCLPFYDGSGPYPAWIRDLASLAITGRCVVFPIEFVQAEADMGRDYRLAGTIEGIQYMWRWILTDGADRHVYAAVSVYRSRDHYDDNGGDEIPYDPDDPDDIILS